MSPLLLHALSLRTAALRVAAATALLVPGQVLAAGLPASAATSPTPAATAAPSGSARVGLYGSQDPTYDGVYRQSLALVALSAGGRTPADAAVQWLLDQQCADGGWTAFRAEPATACDPATEDTNATGVAVQALAALGESGPATRGTDWLAAQQQADGGVGYSAGGATDANSTGLFVSALVAVGVDPATVTTAGRSPYDALRSLQVGCDGAVAERGAYDFQPKDATRHANDFATVQATLAAAGKALPVAPAPGTDDQPTLTCPGPATSALTPTQSAGAGAGYLARLLTANKGAVPSSFGSGPDYGSTANAVIALVATGKGASAARLAGTVLAKDGLSWAGTQPAALALLALSSHALGNDDSAILTRLAATLTPRTPVSTPTATPNPTATRTPGSTATPTPAATAGSEPTASAPTDPATTAVPTATAAPFPGAGSGSTGTDSTGTSGTGAGSGGRLSSTGASGLVPLSLGGLVLLVTGAITIRRARRQH